MQITCGEERKSSLWVCVLFFRSDKSRAMYYEVISNQTWGDKKNYDLCLNCEIGNEKIVQIICNYVQNK